MPMGFARKGGIPFARPLQAGTPGGCAGGRTSARAGDVGSGGEARVCTVPTLRSVCVCWWVCERARVGQRGPCV